MKTPFNQSEVLEVTSWENFKETYEMLGYKVSVTGGNDLTHEINCNPQGLELLILLASEIERS